MRKTLLAALVIAIFMSANPLLAQLGSDDPDRKPALDPFQVLIKPKAPPPQIIPTNVTAPPSAPPPPPPIQFSVKAIAGESPNYVAVLNYNGNDYIAEEGWESEDKAFVVKQIGPNKNGEFEVEIYNKRSNKLQHKKFAEPKIPGYEGPGGSDF